MGVGAGLYMCDVVVKSSRSLSHLLMSSCIVYYMNEGNSHSHAWILAGHNFDPWDTNTHTHTYITNLRQFLGLCRLGTRQWWSPKLLSQKVAQAWNKYWRKWMEQLANHLHLEMSAIMRVCVCVCEFYTNTSKFKVYTICHVVITEFQWYSL